MGELNVAIVGIGNCASSLVQGLAYYQDVADGDDVPGLVAARLGGYHVSDVNVVCGFDVDERKVGRDVAEAIFADPNCAMEALEEVPDLDAPVHMAPVADGVPELARGDDGIRVADRPPVDPATKLDAHDVDVLVNLLPVGARKATEAWMHAALETGTAAVNAVPERVASDEAWAARFEDAGVPVLGDGLDTQVGATAAHRALSRLFEERGVDTERTYQLNVSGNTDFLTLQDADRAQSKRESKTQAVQRELEEPLDDHDIKVAPSDYVPFLDDNKVAFLRVEGRGFLDAPVELEVRLSVENSPNSAGLLLDAVRCAGLALDDGRAGPLPGPSSAFFQRPPQDHPEREARRRLEAFLEDAGAG